MISSENSVFARQSKRGQCILRQECVSLSVVGSAGLSAANCLSVKLVVGGSLSISADSYSDETLNRGPWRCCCGDSMNFPLGLI